MELTTPQFGGGVKMNALTRASLCGALSVVQWGVTAFVPPEATSPPSERIVAVSAYRVSKLVGMEVKNQANEDLGTIKELVVDVETGKVMYVALSIGGVLGIGDKLLAVPWKEFQLKHDEAESYFVLKIAKAKLGAAPGFDEDNWPDVADQGWRDDIDRYYQQEKEQARDAAAPQAK
jgi:sporulation protein YlmC with PRC-barrel domain